jgi:hypothetical protein
MRRLLVITAVLILSLGSISESSAYFIGDDVTFEYWVKGDLRNSKTVTVQDRPDETDFVVWEFGTTRLDVDEDRFTLDMIYKNAFSSSGLFWGYKVLGLENVQNPDWIFLGVSVESDLPGWSANRFQMTSDEDGIDLAFNLQGMSLPEGSSLTAVFDFGPNPIPIPATAALFVTGLIGFALIRKRIRN